MKGGTGAIVEYFGPGARLDLGHRQGDDLQHGRRDRRHLLAVPVRRRASAAYLKATGREALADLADAYAEHLRADPEVEADPERFFDRVIEIDLVDARAAPRRSRTRPTSPARSPRSAAAAEREGYPTRDLGRARRLVHQLVVRGHRPRRARRPPGRGARACGCKTPLLITPGSEQVRATIERDGLLADLEAIGATVLANACGPCIGQWQRDDIADGRAEHDRHVVQPQLPGAQRRQRERRSSFIGSPETVDRDGAHRPARRRLRRRPSPRPTAPRCSSSRRSATSCRPRASIPGEPGSSPPADDPASVDVVVAPDSRSARAARAVPGRGTATTIAGLPVLLKAKGKCTTDHISPAGPWLKYRGHLDEHLAATCSSASINAFTGDEPGTGIDARDGSVEPLPDLAKRLQATPGIEWVAIGDENYGEGSSREHAAMEPRFMGGRA